jgi:hypothetical protein
MPLHFRFNSGIVPTMWYFVLFHIYSSQVFIQYSSVMVTFSMYQPTAEIPSTSSGGGKGRHLDRGCQVKMQKTWMWTIVGSICGCLCASTSLGYVIPFEYSYYFCIAMINMYKPLIGQETNLVNFVDNCGCFLCII